MGYSHQSGADIRFTSYILMIRADDSVQACYSFSSRFRGETMSKHQKSTKRNICKVECQYHVEKKIKRFKEKSMGNEVE